MTQVKVKPNSQDLKNKSIVTAQLKYTSVDYDVENMVFRTYEVYTINGKTYSHHDVLPLSKEQIDKLSIDIPAAIVAVKFDEIEHSNLSS